VNLRVFIDDAVGKIRESRSYSALVSDEVLSLFEFDLSLEQVSSANQALKKNGIHVDLDNHSSRKSICVTSNHNDSGIYKFSYSIADGRPYNLRSGAFNRGTVFASLFYSTMALIIFRFLLALLQYIARTRAKINNQDE